MNNKFKLKIEDKFQFKNDATFKYEFKQDFKELLSVIQKILFFKPVHSNYDNKVYFVLNYKNTVPKTGRFIFMNKNQIRTKEDLPWKSITIKHGESKILYGITETNWNNFIQNLNYILESNALLDEQKYNTLESKYKEIIGKLKNKYFDKNNPVSLPTKQEKNIYNYNSAILITTIPLKQEEFSYIKKSAKISDDEILEVINDINAIIFKKSAVDKIQNNYPWIIKESNLYENSGLKLVDFNDINSENNVFNSRIFLPKPNKEKTIIGVIDSGINLHDFNKSFSDYIILENHLEEGKMSWYGHGNIVTSLIIANDEINLSYKDNLGNFKVKHFEIIGLSQLNKNSDKNNDNNKKDTGTVSFEHLIKKIPLFLEENKDIKIWNISIGKRMENSIDGQISPLGMFLDHLSSKYKVLFIVSSGNDAVDFFDKSLNSPADSYNALSVGSCEPTEKSTIKKTSYSSFGQINGYIKPELATFGGPNNLDNSKLKGIDVDGINKTTRELFGTSFAAPRITRMAAWLYLNGYTNILEIKSKIINSTLRSTNSKKAYKYGYIDISKPINELDVQFTTQIKNISPYFYPIDLKKVNGISISSSILINYDRMLGDEYSISDFDFELYMIRKDWENIYVGKDKKEKAISPDQIKSPNKITIAKSYLYNKIGFSKNEKKKYNKTDENDLRVLENKFFSSKKKESLEYVKDTTT